MEVEELEKIIRVGSIKEIERQRRIGSVGNVMILLIRSVEIFLTLCLIYWLIVLIKKS